MEVVKWFEFWRWENTWLAHTLSPWLPLTSEFIRLYTRSTFLFTQHLYNKILPWNWTLASKCTDNFFWWNKIWFVLRPSPVGCNMWILEWECMSVFLSRRNIMALVLFIYLTPPNAQVLFPCFCSCHASLLAALFPACLTSVISIYPLGPD